MVALHIFGLPWVYMAIIQQYWVRRDWNASLVGLDTTIFHKFFMLGHMTWGAICMLLGPLQFIPSLRQKYPAIHRWSGRTYVVTGLLSGVFGLVFIGLKGGLLVGGYNMGLAFTSAGLCFGYCALKLYLEARAGNFVAHRNWAIRSYGQALSPMLYRYWYVVIAVLGWFDLEEAAKNGCNQETGLCPSFSRTFDAIHCWSYWLFSLGVTEVIVRAMPNNVTKKSQHHAVSTDSDEAVGLQNEATVGYGSGDGNIEDATPADATSSMLAFNTVGISVAIVAVGTTTVMFASAVANA